MLHLPKSKLKADGSVTITGSKSISNRLLILQALFGHIGIRNISNAEDTQLLSVALKSHQEVTDIHHAGTAMRFLTSFFAVQKGKNVILTGSERMKQRPIAPLVQALRDLGAEVEYLEKEGFPPLKITGKEILANEVKIPADISSQFITSLILVAGKLKNGLKIELTGKITSLPYLEMTLELLREVGIPCKIKGHIIEVQPVTAALAPVTCEVESDWSSASYYYSLAALGRQPVTLKSLRQHSLQGDSVIADLYSRFFGVESVWLTPTEVQLKPKEEFELPEIIQLDMNHCPDIAQTLCVTASALRIPFIINGLSTLKVKETDRLNALQQELKKTGCDVEITDESIRTTGYRTADAQMTIQTYNDHRMAMSFAPFCLQQSISIENPDVVEKSYPGFWADLAKITEPAKNLSN